MLSTRRITQFGSPTALHGVFLTLAAVTVVELVSRLVHDVPVITAMMAVVAYVAYVDGSRVGVLSAGMTSLYSVFFFSAPGHLFHYSSKHMIWLILLAVSMGAVVMLVGALRQAMYATQEQLQQQVELNRAINDSLGEGLYTLDREGRVTYMNPMAERLLGWTRAELAGKVMHDVIHYQRPDGTPFPREECTGLMEALRSHQRFRADDDVFIRKDGTKLPVAYSTAPIMVSGNPVGVVVAFRDMTAQQQAVATLRRNEAYFRSLVQYASELITVTREDGTVMYQSPAIEHVLGYKAADLVGKVFIDTLPIHADDRPRVEQHLASILTEPGTVVTDEIRVRHADGSWRTIETTARNLLGEPSIRGVVSTHRDITMRKQAEDALRASEATLRLMHEQIPAHVWVTDTAMRVTSTSGNALPPERSSERYLGQTLDELIEANDLREMVLAAYRRALQGESAEYELNVEAYTFACRVEPLRDGQGEIVGCVGLAVDITEHKRNEQRLATQYTVSRVLVETSSVDEAAPRILQTVGECLNWDYGGLWLIDNNDRTLHCVATWAAPGAGLSSFIAASRETTFAIDEGFPGRIWHQREPHWLSNSDELSAFPRLALAAAAGLRAGFGLRIDIDGVAIGVIEFLSKRTQPPNSRLLDMTRTIGYQVGQFVKRQRAEQELKIRARQQAAIANLGHKALAIPDLAAVLHATAILVVETLGVKYCGILELLPDGKQLLLKAGIGWRTGVVGTAMVEAGNQSQAGYTIQAAQPIIVTDSGSETRFQAAPLLQEHGVVSSIMVVIYDRRGGWGVLGVGTTERHVFSTDDVHFLQAVANVLGAAIERKAFEQQLAYERAETQRLTELEQLRREFIKSVSHELRTPLTAMRGGLGMLETSLVERLQPAEQQLLKNSRRNVERLRSLIDDLLLLNQIETGTLQINVCPTDLRTIVADTLPIVAPLVEDKGQSLRIDLPEALIAWIDQRWMSHVIANVLMNAYLHTPPSTHIVVAGRYHEGHVELSVADNGPGIPVEELENVFQHSYQLGSAEGGTGLGLQVARAIVELQHGQIWADNRAEGGVMLTISLPSARHDREAEC